MSRKNRQKQRRKQRAQERKTEDKLLKDQREQAAKAAEVQNELRIGAAV